MGKGRLSDTIWLDDIAGDPALSARLEAMRPGERVQLDVDGHVGRWERFDAVRDGLTAHGLRALDSMPALLVEIRPVGPNETHLATFEERLYRWDIPENRIR
jgi:hypothetical protein